MGDFKLERFEPEEIKDNLFYYPLKTLENYGHEINKFPLSFKIILESLIRNHARGVVDREDIEAFLRFKWGNDFRPEIPFYVSRIVMHDLGLANLIDLATFREVAMSKGVSPSHVNPVLPVDIVIDHSVQVDYYGTQDAFELNLRAEFSRNRERYEFIKWISRAFDNITVLPPSIGIIHQVNLEYLSRLVTIRSYDGKNVIFPDTLLGLDSHTTMINGLGVLGWGVGGIEGMAVMFGEPIYLKVPDVVGVKLKGKPGPGVLATDIALTLTELLRKKNVVDKFVEFFGNSVSELNVFDRATISNMCPEYGATVGLFPIDEKTIEFLRLTGKDKNLINLVKDYYTVQGMFGQINEESFYSEVIELDLSEVEPSIAGPNLPNRRISFADLKNSFESYVMSLNSQKDKGGNAL